MARRWRAAGAALSVVLALTGCATAPGRRPAAEPQPLSSPESAYPATPFARIETGMHVAAAKGIDLDAAERFLVSGSEDKTVRVWNLANGTLLQTLRVPIDEGDVGKVYAVAISPDRATIAAGGFTGQPNKTWSIYLFDRESGALPRRIGGLENGVAHLTFSRDGRRLAATLGDQTAYASTRP